MLRKCGDVNYIAYTRYNIRYRSTSKGGGAVMQKPETSKASDHATQHANIVLDADEDGDR